MIQPSDSIKTAEACELLKTMSSVHANVFNKKKERFIVTLWRHIYSEVPKFWWVQENLLCTKCS